MKLTINLATRNRPELCIETIRRTLENIALPSTRLIVSVDQDDNRSCQELSMFAMDHERVKVVVAKREDSLGEKYNRALQYPADVYLMMVDYAPHITPAFDKLILDAASVFPDNIGVVYNRLANLSFPEINAVTHGLAMQMGFIYPPWFPYWFVDHWLDDIARMIERVTYADVKIDTRKRPGTQDKRDVEFWSLLFDALHIRRRKVAHAIIDSPEFQGEPWRKQISKSIRPLVEQRTLMLNNSIRAEHQNPAAYNPSGDLWDEERYVRIKTRGMELMKELLPELWAEQAEEAA